MSKKELKKILKNPKGKIIAVDLDGTLCEGEYWGEDREPKPKPEMIKLLEEIHLKRGTIIIYTARWAELYRATYAWLIKHKVPFHGICMQIKPGADLYIDDKALNPEDIFEK